MEMQSLFPEVDGGSTPTPPLQPKHFRVRLCTEIEIRDFVEQNHYSKNMNGVMSDCCFSLVYEGAVFGAAVFAGMATDAWKKFSDVGSDVLELRRFCLLDSAPKNSESFFLGYCVRFLKKHSNAKIIVSYADESQGHVGTIYKAVGFSYEGATKTAGKWCLNGREYHDKTIRTTYKGKLKPFAERLVKAIADGEATKTEPSMKHCFICTLDNGSCSRATKDSPSN